MCVVLVSIQDLVVDRGHRVRLKEVEGYASSHYHIHHPSTVQREPSDNTVGVSPVCECTVKNGSLL